MAIIDVMPITKAVQYNGSNASEVVDVLNLTTSHTNQSHTLNTANGSAVVVNVHDMSNTIINAYTINTGNWVVVHAGFITELDVPDAKYNAAMRSMAATGTLLASVGAGGAFGSLPNIVVPGSSNANFDVTIRPAMPNTSYTAVPVLTGSASLLGSLSITNVTGGALNNAGKLSGSTVRVNVANSGLLQLSGAAILVHVTP